MVPGVFLLVLTAIDMLAKLARIALGVIPLWYFALLLLDGLVLYGLFHGIRAARGAKRLGALAETNLQSVFD